MVGEVPEHPPGTRSSGDARASVGSTLRNAFAGFLVVIVLLGITAFGVVQVTSRSISQLTDTIEPQLDLNSRLLQAMTDAESGERGYLITGDERFLEPFEEGRTTIPALVRELRAAAGDDDELLALLEAQEDALSEWLNGFAVGIVELARTDLVAAGQQASTGQGRGRFIRFRTRNAAVDGHLDAARTATLDDISEVQTRAVVVAGSLSVAGAVAAIGLSRYARRRIVAPLADLDRTIQEVRTGNLDVTVAVGGPTEIRSLSSAVESMVAASREMETQRRRRTEHLVDAAQLTRSIRASLDLDEVVRVTVEELARVLGVDRVAVALGPEIRLDRPATWASGPEADDVTPPDELRALVDEAVAELGVVAVADTADPGSPVHDRPSAAAYVARHGIASIAVAAVTLGGRTIGTLAAWCSTPRTWEPLDEQLLVLAGRELGAAIEHAQLFESQKEMVIQLHALDAARSEFVSSVSHELRTPLASIMGYTEMLLDGDAGDVSDAQCQMLEAIDRSAARLLALVEDLLIVARIEAGRFHIERQEVDLARVIESAVEAVGTGSRRRDLALGVEVEHPLPLLQADPRHLERVIANLLGNAVKFTPDGGSVTVRARHDEAADALVVEVQDTGLGIPEAEQAHVFDRFFRSTVSRERAVQGTGLGLAIVKAVVEEHGGHVTLRSAEGTGTTFSVHLPIRPTTPAEERRP